MVSAKSRTASHTEKQFAGPVGLPNRILPERDAMTIVESDDDAARLIVCPETVIHFDRFDSRAASSTEYRAARRSDTNRRGNVSIDCDPRGQVDDTIYAAGCGAKPNFNSVISKQSPIQWVAPAPPDVPTTFQGL